MSKVGIFGAGWVGLVTGACFAELGHDVVIRDVVPEKIEGLAWGPDLADGRHLLYVITDNDLSLVNPTQIYAFAVDDAELLTPLDLQPQTLPGPLYPPGQVKKALGGKSK